MNINNIYINNYKSLIDFEIVDPQPFTVFFGSNASGKSNLFEAMEFVHRLLKYGSKLVRDNYSFSEIFPFRSQLKSDKIDIEIKADVGLISIEWDKSENLILKTEGNVEQLFENNFTRLFIGKENLVKHPYTKKEFFLNLFAGNLENVLDRLLRDPLIEQELMEWLQHLIPEFKDVKVKIDNQDREKKLLVYEEYSNKPFPKNLISDGTYNILCLLTAVYQSDSPQVLFVEEPENGLNPKVIKELVDFCREISVDKGHHIWLNTHSQSLVSKVKTSEGILVDKKQGITKVKQFKDKELFDLTMDEAWLSNVLGGGTPW